MRFFTLCAVVLLFACSDDVGGEQATTDVDASVINDIKKTGSGNNAPKLHKVGNKEVQVGEELEIILKADDSDGDTLNFSVYGDMPPGAKFYKPEGRFTWAPDGAGGPYAVTFVVSDLKDFDSETVELRAVTSKTQHPPQFESPGDQFLKIGVLYELHLEASDQDGDSLHFSIKGNMPAGATFDAENAMFRWTPSNADKGQLVRVTFVVSDGALTDEMEVALTVEGGANTNHPPEVDPIGAINAEVGQKVDFQITATDPDGNQLTYGYEGTLPTGATFDAGTHKFFWTPSAPYAGKSEVITFTVSDGQLTAKTEATILVKGQAGTCGDDANEPNNEPDQATPLQPGDYANLSICDTQLSPIDADWFKITLSAGDHIEAAIAFTHSQGDLDLGLFQQGTYDKFVFYAPGVGDEEKVSYTAAAGGDFYLVAFGTAAGTYAVPYTLSYEKSGGGETCSPDGKEPNNSLNDAYLLDETEIDGTVLQGLSICPGDVDTYAVMLDCGDSVVAGINFSNAQGDLDMYLFDSTLQNTLDQSTSSSDYETVALDGAFENDFFYIVVSGYPKDTTSNSYTMEVMAEPGGACIPDGGEPNDSSSQATMVAATSTVTDLTLCCDKDWFVLPAGPGKATVTITATSGTAMDAWFVDTTDPNNPKELLCSPGSCAGVVDLPTGPTMYLWLEGTFGASYSVDFVIEDSGGTEGSCVGNCGGDGGGCWCDSGCHQFGDCCPDVCQECDFCMEA
jgi:hypothetical protein